MAIAYLSQNGNAVELPLLSEGGDILMAADLGKPELNVHNTGGTAFPRIMDQWSGMKQMNLIGVLKGSDAYDRANDLVELIHSDGGGEPMILDIPALDELDSDLRVAPSAEQDRALNLSYQPGEKDRVEFDLGLTRVDQVLGGYDRVVDTPRATGSGPVTLSGLGNTIELVSDIVVDRYAGRPNDVIRGTTNPLPNYIVKRKIVNDEFEISLLFSSDAVAQTRELADLFSNQLGRQSLTLDFNGLYGLGEFNVMPSGSQALRHIRESGQEGVTIIPQISLQRVHQD